MAKSHWNPTLTDRQRVLLHTQPLILMRYHWSMHEDDGQTYDPLCLSMKLFDVVIDQSGFGNDVVRESVTRAIVPLLQSIDTSNEVERDEARYNRVIDRLFGGLMNDSNRGESFTINYSDFDGDGKSSQLTFSFKLLREVHGYSGDIALELSPEAINLFLNALDLDIESEQIANEAVVQFQLDRGNFDKARSSAETARARSMQFEQKIHRVIEQAKRDIRQVDWQNEVHQTLLDANEHVDVRLRIEDDIIRSARNKLDTLADQDEKRYSLSEVSRLMDDCLSRHMRLSKRLMTARGDFIEQQSRQCFVDAELAQQVDLRDELLRPMLALPLKRSLELSECCGHTLLGPDPPPLLSLTKLVAWQLHPKREQSIGEAPLAEIELIDTNAEVHRLDDQVWADCQKVFVEVNGTIRLTELLDRLENDGCPPTVQDAVALQILEWFDPENEEGMADVKVEFAAADGLSTSRCEGDDLLVTPLIQDIVRSPK